jgi:hypothetical protein
MIYYLSSVNRGVKIMPDELSGHMRTDTVEDIVTLLGCPDRR